MLYLPACLHTDMSEPSYGSQLSTHHYWLTHLGIGSEPQGWQTSRWARHALWQVQPCCLPARGLVSPVSEYWTDQCLLSHSSSAIALSKSQQPVGNTVLPLKNHGEESDSPLCLATTPVDLTVIGTQVTPLCKQQHTGLPWRAQRIPEALRRIISFFLSFFIYLLQWHQLIKLCRFQGCNSVTASVHCILCSGSFCHHSSPFPTSSPHLSLWSSLCSCLCLRV